MVFAVPGAGRNLLADEERAVIQLRGALRAYWLLNSTATNGTRRLFGICR
jgi:hypothetical protein